MNTAPIFDIYQVSYNINHEITAQHCHEFNPEKASPTEHPTIVEKKGKNQCSTSWFNKAGTNLLLIRDLTHFIESTADHLKLNTACVGVFNSVDVEYISKSDSNLYIHV